MELLDSIEVETGVNPRTAMIVLHGLGADGNDFLPVTGELDMAQVGPIRFVLPHAPAMPVTINGGYRMPAWYDILGTESQGGQDEAGLRKSLRAIDALIEREKQRGVPSERIVVAGFSQGCAMALLTGLRHRERLAGIVGMSGYLPLAETTAAEASEANRATPVWLAHGTQDAVVVAERGRASRDVLASLGYDVRWNEYPMGHSVCMEEIRDLNAWLLEALA